MPIYIPLSVKIAVTAGALIGGAVALGTNKERLLDAAEQIFQAGATFCKHQKEKVKQANMAFADSHSDGSFEYRESGTMSEFSSGQSTPDISDDEEDEEVDPEDFRKDLYIDELEYDLD